MAGVELTRERADKAKRLEEVVGACWFPCYMTCSDCTSLRILADLLYIKTIAYDCCLADVLVAD